MFNTAQTSWRNASSLVVSSISPQCLTPTTPLELFSPRRLDKFQFSVCHSMKSFSYYSFPVKYWKYCTVFPLYCSDSFIACFARFYSFTQLLNVVIFQASFSAFFPIYSTLSFLAVSSPLMVSTTTKILTIMSPISPESVLLSQIFLWLSTPCSRLRSRHPHWACCWNLQLSTFNLNLSSSLLMCSVSVSLFQNIAHRLSNQPSEKSGCHLCLLSCPDPLQPISHYALTLPFPNTSRTCSQSSISTANVWGQPLSPLDWIATQWPNFLVVNPLYFYQSDIQRHKLDHITPRLNIFNGYPSTSGGKKRNTTQDLPGMKSYLLRSFVTLHASNTTHTGSWPSSSAPWALMLNFALTSGLTLGKSLGEEPLLLA